MNKIKGELKMPTKILYEGVPYFHPGLLLKDILESRGIEQKDLAQRTGFSEKHISFIITGKNDITPSFAEKIAIALNENSITWLNMQSEYNNIKEQIALKDCLSKETEILDLYPIKDMIKYKLIEKSKEKWKQLKSLMSFLGIGDISKIRQFSTELCLVKYRKLESSDTKEATSVLHIWGKKIAESNHLSNPYNKEKLELAIKTIRHNMKLPFVEALELIKKSLADAGVIFVFTPKIQKASASGFCYKYKNNYVIHLNSRTVQIDTFWFSLFHELSHVLDDDIGKEESSDLEKKSDNYARNIIIEDAYWDEYWFRHAEKYSVDNVTQISKIKQIPIECVIGRLQKEGKVLYNNISLNKLKKNIKLDNFDGIDFNI